MRVRVFTDMINDLSLQAGHIATDAKHTRARIFNLLFFGMLFFSVYSEPPLVLRENLMIPGISLLVLIPLAVVYMNKMYKSDLVFIFLLFCIAPVSVVFAGNISYLPTLPSKFMQYGVSIFMGFIVFRAITFYSHETATRVFWYFCLFLLIGTLLERIGVLRPVTLYYKELLYSNTAYGGGFSDVRDLRTVGFERPMFFTSEPSLLGLGYYVFSIAFLILNKVPKKDYFIIISNILMLFIVGSPTSFLSVLACVVVLSYKRKFSVMKNFLLISVFVFVTAVIIFVPPFNGLMKGMVARLSVQELTAGNSSSYARIYVPYFVNIPLIITTAPLFGAGFGCYDALNTLLRIPANILPTSVQFFLGSNSFANFFYYFGVVGLIIYLFCFYLFFRHNRISGFKLYLFLWFCMNQIIGTFVTPRYWSYQFIIIAAFYINARYKEKLSERVGELTAIKNESNLTQ